MDPAIPEEIMQINSLCNINKLLIAMYVDYLKILLI